MKKARKAVEKVEHCQVPIADCQLEDN
jgi:hypothetical protein